MMRRNFFAPLLLLFVTPLFGAISASLPSDADIRKILVDRIDRDHRGVGIVVGVIDSSGRRVVAVGSADRDGGPPLNGDTLFEIGSVTKVFTSLLLADAVQRGEVSLDDPVAKYLPAGVKVPERRNRKITLVDLATHTSGLPRLPLNLMPKDPQNPYAGYTVQQLYDFLSTYQLSRDIGSQYEYSNVGGGLLGHVLARRAGVDYETLVRTRITEPLGMTSTVVTLSSALNPRLARGHDDQLRAVANWDLPTLAGAGALRSSANDLLTFLAANLGQKKSPLAAAMTSMLATRRPTGTEGMSVALGWHTTTNGDREIVWHNGATGGYRSFLAFDRKRGLGVVVLANAATTTGIDDIGRHLLDPAVALAVSASEKEGKIDSKRLDAYVGRYQLQPRFILTITREGDHLFLQATGQPRFEMFPSSEGEFFLKVVDARISFQADAEGHVPSLILHQNGAHMPASRIAGEAPAPKQRTAIAVDPAILERYVGRYQLTPAFIITVTREGGQLFAQATGQQRFELFAENEHEFFIKDVDAQVSFEIDPAGRVTRVILHQDGASQPALRME
jgi:D-alanyl-D-alanine-carboxypeptidase/D-alanyl-D-alanine-endopeptidase